MSVHRPGPSEEVASTSRELDKQPFFRKSRAGATTGNGWQNRAAPNTAETGETVAAGCDRFPPRFHGK
jgi:hypothetical protein